MVWNQSTLLSRERQSVTELRVVCTVAREWQKLTLQLFSLIPCHWCRLRKVEITTLKLVISHERSKSRACEVQSLQDSVVFVLFLDFLDVCEKLLEISRSERSLGTPQFWGDTCIWLFPSSHFCQTCHFRCRHVTVHWMDQI